MRHNELIDLFYMRNENALKNAETEFGKYCFKIAFSILKNHEDAKECVNDTLLKAWNAIPPNRPENLSIFLAKITRNLAFDRLKQQKAQKRGGGEAFLSLDELDECIASRDTTEQEFSEKELVNAIDCFLYSISEKERNLFIARYWYAKSISEMALEFFMRPANVKTALFRIRKKLKEYLIKEDIFI